MQDSERSNSQDAIDELIYRISHDLRSPIRALMDLPSWIEEDLTDAGIVTPDKVTKTLFLMEQQAERLNSMVNGLLIQSRVGRSDQQKLNVAELLNQKAEQLKLPAGTRMRMRLDPAVLKISAVDLEQALSILIDNALVHGVPAAETGQNARIAVIGRNLGDEWVLAVRDNGPGIPVKFHAKVFQPMTVLHGVSEEKGIGMGLAILSKIASTYGGQANIQKQDAAGRGATVCLRLPIL